ncbi:galactose mutarotase-like enzyme [Pontibacter ummariensis]|uniref:Galactose mutarotase n=1 Tax=Pontibacter ummariensis TaxID=1610492 RepID=A0A239LR51_9BACT|nr:aldose 1-epimerase family protein [Pontibacter ummariensis]PRY02927.1 galactose mutarotase-like enzyme [Pontibacter ummariensis]SNT32149.1 Galactose mutarotase [Pontibacter ummariensis]
MADSTWKNKICNPAQVGGIETSVIDNGHGRGTRIAWVNTGTGLRYKVVIDRAMDVADAFYNQHSLAWLSYLGVTPPEPFSNRGADWLRTFGGGLLVTCGLTHTGGPEADAYGERGLHGQVSNIPAEIESVIQPDPLVGKMEMSITGRIKQTQLFGPNLELRRTISGKIGQATLTIHDEVINRGNTPAPHMLLYHFNFGWPLIDAGTDIIWQGEWRSREGEPNNIIFREGNNFRKCPSPLTEHNGTGEEAAFINVTPNKAGQCICGFHNSKIGVALTLRFQKEQLPWLTNWQHWGEGEYVTGLEPGTNPPIGQAKAREQGELIYIAPGECRTYDLEIEVLRDEAVIRDFLRNNLS